MFGKCNWKFGAALLCTLGYCNSTWAQLYTAPNVSSVESRIYTPNVALRANSQLQNRLDAGYSGVRPPALANLPSMQSSGASRIGLGLGASSRSSKPFSSYSSQPTVSPYLNLFRTDLNGGGNFNYSTLVQPQLQQQQLNQQLERQNLQTNRRLQAIAAQSDYNPEGSKDQYPTGHQTVYQYTGHYYPVARPHPKQAVQR